MVDPRAKHTWTTTPEILSTPLEGAAGDPQGDDPPSLAHWLLSWMRARLASGRAHGVIIAVTLLLSVPMLWLDYDTDDYFQVAALNGGSGIEGAARAPWDLYTFAKDPETARALRNAGVWPWWTDPEVRLAFFRPLASLSRWVDESLWPHSIPTMQLQSMLWALALFWTASRLYRAWLPVPWVGALALFLFVSDDARASTIAWLCNRNAPISLAFGFAALHAHHRARALADRRAAWLAPLWLALGLLGGETALQVGGYLLAYALFLDRGTLTRRFVSLLPYGAVVIAWGVAYKLLGYGASPSAFYVDPIGSPRAFLEGVPERLLIYALSLFGGGSADLFDLLPMFELPTRPIQLPLAIVCTSLTVLALAPLYRRDRHVRFWALGCLLAALPACGVKPADRMLTGAALGGMALLATLFGSLVDRTYPRKPRAWLTVFAAGLALINLGYAPIARPFLIASNDGFDLRLGHADASIARTPSLRDETLVLMNPPWDTFAIFFPFYRAAHELPRPRHYRWLATGVSDLTVERVDASTLKLTQADGFLSVPSQQLMRSPTRPMHVGEQVALDGVTLEVVSLTPDARPLSVLARFTVPLESPTLRFMKWHAHGYEPFEPPPVGTSVTLPKVDLPTALAGPDFEGGF